MTYRDKKLIRNSTSYFLGQSQNDLELIGFYWVRTPEITIRD